MCKFITCEDNPMYRCQRKVVKKKKCVSVPAVMLLETKAGV